MGIVWESRYSLLRTHYAKMNILDKIVANTQGEVAARKSLITVAELEKLPLFNRTPLVAKDFIRDSAKSGIIAEIKKKSPSKGIINDKVDVVEVGIGYEAAGASCISCLTEFEFFGGKMEYLTAVKKAVNIPVLRKDFMVEEYQVIEAKAIGADMILLIAACLTPAELENLAKLAKSLGLSVLMEVHDEEELKRSINPYLDLVGVNNRNLKTFDVSVETSIRLAELIPNEFLKVSESGLTDVSVIPSLKAAGYEAFLIGETFMREENPAANLADYISKMG